ncbi:sensor domain-containing diguanylate cyclase [Demequina muriae]|uniref:Diguanylate cyclase n=1 Tax=Demequina muriae TaxID=3051664 RepID=A0ABT8GDH0_9MICO|nr:sensor domain-containing diguanylate cyclase [Demequina sp. EGI L300058]MDN4479472.1 diguanylate cyclase [Demequina sp. EGI L300058]
MSSRTRIPRHLGARGYTVASGLIVGVVLIQLTAIVVAAGFAGRQVNEAAGDTYSYVGDLTAARVAHYADSGRDLVDDTALFLTYASDLDREALTASMVERLSRADSVRTLYVGWEDGRFLAVSRTEDGYQSQWIEQESASEVVTRYDAQMVLIDQSTLASDYDPRTRPWYVTATSANAGAWTQAYLDYGKHTTLVSPVAAVRTEGSTLGVVAADLDLPTLRSILDDLPYGAGAEAFVLSPSLEVIGAPSRYTERLETLAEESGGVPTAADLGIDVGSAALDPGDALFTRSDSMMVLDQSLPATASVDWRIHLTAETSQLSAGLSRVGSALWWVSGLSIVLSAIAAIVAWNVNHSMRRMRVRASTDQLTGLANRHEYERAGRSMLLQAAIRGERVLAVVLDLDGFKAINDALGHDVGDAALAATGEAIKSCVRAEDVAARLGGDEFVVLQPLGPQDDPHAIVERLRETVARQLAWLPAEGVNAGVTVGYALSRPGMDLKGMVALADAALLEGKRNAKGTVHRG